MAAIRGVNVDGVMRTLQQRGYIDEVARDPGPGLAVLYGTTRLFLERLGLDSLDDLPSLAEFVPGAEVVEALEQAAPDRRAADDAPWRCPKVTGACRRCCARGAASAAGGPARS